MTAYKKKTTTQTKNIFLVVLILLLIVGLAAFILRRKDKSDTAQQNINTPSVSENRSQNSESDSAKTEDDAKAVDTESEKSDTDADDSAPADQQASIVITRAEQFSENIEVAAYVRDIFEDGGVCKATFTNTSDQSLKINKDTMGIKDVSETVCPTFIVPRDEFSKLGTWKVTVDYIAIDGTKLSAEKTFEVR